eukprot:3681374-Pleurochrysis_carterae.AAC.1
MPAAASAALVASCDVRTTTSVRRAASRSLSRTPFTTAPKSRGGAPDRVRRRSAARDTRRNTSRNNSSPRSCASEPSPAHACRASSPSPNEGS